MVYRGHRLAEILCSVLLVVPVSCKKDTPQPPPGTVPLKVWVVLNTQASDVFDQSGSDDNQGCRLSRANITSYINALMNNRHIFGANFQFTWDGSITEVRTSRIPLCFPFQTCDRRTDLAQAMTDIAFVQGEWATNHINIYFAGWMSLNPSTNQMDAGITADPGGKPDIPFIVINDRGWNASSGSFMSLPD